MHIHPLARIAAVALAMITAAAVYDFESRHRGPQLHRLMVIGDSVTFHSVRYIHRNLPGVQIGVPPDNARSSSYMLLNMDDWDLGAHWDVIHFNVGLWDMKYVVSYRGHHRCDKAHGHITTPIETYRKNLEAIVPRLQATGALVIFATSTPSPEDNECIHSEDVPRYNAVALEVMQRHHIPVDDLYTFMLPHGGDHQDQATVHFSDAGNEVLGQHIAAYIQRTWQDHARAIPEGR